MIRDTSYEEYLIDNIRSLLLPPEQRNERISNGKN